MEHTEQVTDLYIASIPDAPIDTISLAARQALIEKTVNEPMKRQRYYVWKLLEYALKNSFLLQPETIAFSVDENGKWSCPDCYFSLSHCNDAVAVAVSATPVGVDIEKLDRTVAPGLCRKVLTDKELLEYNQLNDSRRHRYLLEKWCAKESLFKVSGGKQFSPCHIETNETIQTGVLNVADQPILYAVANNAHYSLRIFPNIQL